ncbi:amino acid permease [Actinomadura vinacea]|uniref:Amino acid permease n=1 Tax=Actinomadura vinacea TaxID=115336 RepID=A0ABP5WUI9_9ACTN
MTASTRPGGSSAPGIGFFRNVAQPLSVSGPSAGTAILPATMVAVTGTAGAGSFLLGLVAGSLIVYVFASLARQFSSAGAAYHYAGVLCGVRVAILVGWAYLVTYLAFAGSVLSNEANFVGVAIRYADGPSVPWPLVAFVLWAVCMVIVMRRIEFNTGFQVSMETLGVLSLLVVGVTVLVKAGGDGGGLGLDAFSLDGVSPGRLFLGIALALGAFGGFESGASLSEETDRPARTVPAGMWTCLLLSGVLYIFACWFINIGFRGDVKRLAASPAPLFELAESHFGRWVAFTMTVVVVLAGLSTVTAASTGAIRTLFAMGRDGLLRGGFSDSPGAGIPRRVVLLCALPILGLSVGFFWTSAYMAFQYVATAAALMLTAVYLSIVMISVPWFARMRSWPRAAAGVAASALLGYALYASVDSQTAPALRALPYIDLLLIAVAGVFVLVAAPVVRRVNASPHWREGREHRDRLLAERASAPARTASSASIDTSRSAP